MGAGDPGPGTDMYIPVYIPACPGIYTKKAKFMRVHNVGIRTDDLVHSKRHIIPLHYERAHLSDIGCSYKILIL